MRIYVASSWRNQGQPAVVAELRRAGHEVYDFRNPGPGDHGFSWSEVDRDWLDWTPDGFLERLHGSARAADGFAKDKAALDWCEVCVLVLPSGRSAHLEAGYVTGQGKPTVVLLDEQGFEPELMYLLAAEIVTTLPAVVTALASRDWAGA